MNLPERQFLDAAPDAIVVLDQMGNIVLASKQSQSLFGYTEDELLGQSLDILLPEHTSATSTAEQESIAHQARSWKLDCASDLFARHRSGKRLPVEIRLNDVQTEQGAFVVTVIRDISQRIANERLQQETKELTDRQLAQQRMSELIAVTDEANLTRASRDRLSLIIDNAVDEIYVSDASSYQILNTNRAAYTNLGYTEEESLQLMPWDFVEGLTPERVKELIAPLLAGELDVQAIEAVHRRKDGSTYPVYAKLQYMATLSPPVFTAIVQDITNLKQQETITKLRERAIEALDVGVSITDATRENNPIVYINKALCEITGYSSDELLGEGIRILQRNDPAQPEHIKIQEAQAKGESVQVMLKSTRKDGSQYMDELALYPVNDAAGNLTHYIGINRDVTTLLQTQAKLQQTQKIEAIGQLSGGIAHDFNNLLSVITGNLEFLAMEITNGTHREYISEADSAAQMGARLTRRLLAFSKQNQLEPEVLNINNHIFGVTELLHSTIGETISLSADLAPNIWSVLADPSEIENALINLCINARDAMPRGGKIKIITENFGHSDAHADFNIQPGDYVKLSVTDNGTGMTEDVKSRIFDPFFTTKESGRGTGLGLAMIQRFVAQSGGHVQVSSEAGHGTVISLYLPRYRQSQASAELKEPAKVAPGNSAARILVVEDNDLVRTMTVKRLHSLGFEAEQVGNGKKALHYLENNTDIDLVLSDIVMEGGVSGYDVAHWVQSKLPQCKILLTSGFNEHLAEVNDIEVAKLQVLPKPYRLTDLQRAVNEILESPPHLESAL